MKSAFSLMSKNFIEFYQAKENVCQTTLMKDLAVASLKSKTKGEPYSLVNISLNLSKDGEARIFVRAWNNTLKRHHHFKTLPATPENLEKAWLIASKH